MHITCNRYIPGIDIQILHICKRKSSKVGLLEHFGITNMGLHQRYGLAGLRRMQPEPLQSVNSHLCSVI